MIRVLRVVTRVPADWSMSNNGGDYAEGFDVVPEAGGAVLRYWSSYDGDYCSRCGGYHQEEGCLAAADRIAFAD